MLKQLLLECCCSIVEQVVNGVRFEDDNAIEIGRGTGEVSDDLLLITLTNPPGAVLLPCGVTKPLEEMRLAHEIP